MSTPRAADQGELDLPDLDMRARAVPYGEFERLRRESSGPCRTIPGAGAARPGAVSLDLLAPLQHGYSAGGQPEGCPSCPTRSPARMIPPGRPCALSLQALHPRVIRGTLQNASGITQPVDGWVRLRRTRKFIETRTFGTRS